MSYEDKLCHFFNNHSHFLGILAGVHELCDSVLTWRLTAGGSLKSATVVIRMRSLHLTAPYYAVLHRQNSERIEWFDPTGILPPPEVRQWCKDNNFEYLDSLTHPLIAPDRLFLSGEMCAYFIKKRRWHETFGAFQSNFSDFKAGDCTVLSLNGIDFQM